ncbi:SET and MYND domain-containing protein 4-like [Daktulosphaira vitifoliae]|uniref:SET and MYND domain-containing protein 4-like n=1 Tax=Daktulosphaira vitifoliae TaxID=58002 RepID=UPI0021A98B3D|nr:SET and MYND domain-containing protein 4-like [Daktulosphaira vitifoliae]
MSCYTFNLEMRKIMHSFFGMNEYFTEYFKERELMGEVYVTFNKKETSEEKFLYTYNLLKEHKQLPDKITKMCGKSNKIARNIREEANILFAKKDYVKAYCSYNISVMTAKIGSPDYAIALANRSASLYYLKEYEACVSDIHHSIEAKYPPSLFYKLFEREGNCLKKLGHMKLAKEKFKECLLHLNEASIPIDKKKTIEAQIKNVLSNSKTDNEECKIFFEEKKNISLLGGPNKNIPALSKFVKIKYSESMGRCLFATNNINPGDVLTIEKPYAGILCNESFGYNCGYCFKQCLNGIPCKKCTMVIYCDNKCRQKSYENGHKYECMFHSTLVEWPGIEHMEYLSMYIFLKTVSKYGLEEYVSLVRSLKVDMSDSIIRGFNKTGQYLSEEFCSTYSLEGNESKRTVSDLFIRHCYASVIVSCLKLGGLKIPDDLLGIIGESIVHLLCVVASNAHGITQPPNRNNWSLPEMKEFMPVASILLPTLSLLNHHCDPNVVRHNYNGIVILRAIQPIPKNSQLFDNYCAVYASHTKEERQHMIKRQYCFLCECQCCTENWPTYDVLETTQTLFQYPLMEKIDLNFLLSQSSKLYEIISKMKKNECDGIEHLPFLYSFLTILHNHVKKPWIEYCDCQETIKQVLYITTDKFMIKMS